MIRSSVAVSLLVLMEIHSANFRYEERNADLAVSVMKGKSNGTVSITLFNKGKKFEIDSNNDDISNGYYLDNNNQIVVNKIANNGQRFSISDGPSTYVFFVDKDGNIDISSEKQNVDTGRMSFAFRTDGMIKSSNPILFNSLFLYGNRIQNDSILKTRKYTFYYKTFDNYGIFDSRAKRIEPKQFAQSSAILLERLQQFKERSSQSQSIFPINTTNASSTIKNSKNNYGIMLNGYVGYSGSALQVNSYGLTECDSMHFGGTDSELFVKRGKFLVHGAISGTFKSTESIKVEEVADVYVHKVNVRFVEGLSQVQQSPRSLEFFTTLERMGLSKPVSTLPINNTVNISTIYPSIEYSHLWRWKFEKGLNIGIKNDLLLGFGLSPTEIERRKWNCEDEKLINKNDYSRVQHGNPIQINIPGISGAVRLFLVTTGAGGGNSCGFLSLTKNRESVYLTTAATEDFCRKDIIRKLTEAIDSENKEKVLELIAPQLMKYISTKGNAIYSYEENKYKWGECVEESIWNDIEKVFLSEISAIPVDQLTSSKENKKKVEDSKTERDKKETDLSNEITTLLNQIKEKILNDISLIDSLNLSDEEMSSQFTKKTEGEIISITNRIYGLSISKGSNERAIAAETLDQAVSQIKSKASIAKAKIKYSDLQIKQLLTIYTLDNEKLQSLIMHSPALKSKFSEGLKTIEKKNHEIMRLYQLPETMKAYLNKFLNRTGIQLEVTSTETTGVLQAIAYIQKSSLVLVADQDYTIDKVRIEFHKKGEVLIFYDNPEAESVIYAFVHPGHYSKAVTQEQYNKAVNEYK